jgi:hypothetical protein
MFKRNGRVLPLLHFKNMETLNNKFSFLTKVILDKKFFLNSNLTHKLENLKMLIEFYI